MATRTFTAVLHKEGNLYVAQCPEVGTASQGPTIEEALVNLKEATELYLEEFFPDKREEIKVRWMVEDEGKKASYNMARELFGQPQRIS
jgi:predicted RNase H-like HicB family nuclease